VFVCLAACLFVCVFVCLAACPFVCVFVCLAACPFVCYLNCKNDIFKANELISMQIGTSGTQSTGIKLSTLGLRRSKNKVTKIPFGTIRYLKYCPASFNRTWPAAYRGKCPSKMSKVEGQGHVAEDRKCRGLRRVFYFCFYEILVGSCRF